MLLTFGILLVTIVLFMSGRFRADGVAMMALLALLLFGLVDTREALAGFSSGPVMMIAALFVVGGGLTNTGVTHWLGQRLILLAGSSETRLLVWVMIGTGVLSGFMSNTGGAEWLANVVISVTGGLHPVFLLGGVFILTSMLSQVISNTASLLTPIGTVPNLLVMAPGNYSFDDYVKCGVPLTLILFAATLVLVPVVWPF